MILCILRMSDLIYRQKLNEAKKIKNVIANNIILIEISISIIFILFKTNPSIPIKKKY